MKFTCPNCKAENEINPAAMLGEIKTRRKAKAARKNGQLGGRPRKEKPKTKS